jgi:hypothetical protein
MNTEQKIQKIEKQRKDNRKQLDRLIFHGGSTAATTNAIDRRLKEDRKLTLRLAELETSNQTKERT